MRFMTEAVRDCAPLSAEKALEVINRLKAEIASGCSSKHLSNELNYAFTWYDTPMGRQAWNTLYRRLGSCTGSDTELRLELAMLLDQLETMVVESVLDGTYGDDA